MGSGTLPLRDLTALVRGELERINRELEDDLRPQERDLLPLVGLVSGYRGKQIRPALERAFASGKPALINVKIRQDAKGVKGSTYV